MVSEISLTQKFTTINHPAERYTIVLTKTLGFRFYTFKGSKWAKDTECYKATEFWCFVIKRWLTHKLTDDELKHILSSVKSSIPPKKHNYKERDSKLILLRNDKEHIKGKEDFDNKG